MTRPRSRSKGAPSWPTPSDGGAPRRGTLVMAFAALLGCTTLRPPKGPSLAAGVATAEHITAAPRLLDLNVVVRPRLGLDPRLEVEVRAQSDDLPRRFVVQKAWA